MTIKLNWQNQQQMIHMVFPQTATVNDWYMGTSKLCPLFNAVNHPVNVIVDLSELNHLPYDIIASLNAGKPRFHTNHAGQIVVVKSHLRRPMNALLRNNTMMTGTQVVTSIDEAYQAFNNQMPLKKIS